MNVLIPPAHSSRQQYPCPHCQGPTEVDVVTRIETHDEFEQFFNLRLNRARCSFCSCLVEAPVRVVVTFPDAPFCDHECVPLALLDCLDVVDDVARKLDQGAIIVFSHDELERSVEARLRIEMHRCGLMGLPSGDVVPLLSADSPN